MKRREAKELHRKQINIDIKIRKEIKPFIDSLWSLNHAIVNNNGISYKVRDTISYYIPLIQDLYILYNYGPTVADRFIPKYGIIKKRRRYKKHLYA